MLERLVRSSSCSLPVQVREGHVLGDHSSDHMAHNHVGEGYHYLSPEVDLPYFNEANIGPTTGFLRQAGEVAQGLARWPGAGFSPQTTETVATNMRTVKRLPFTDIWRVGNLSTEGDKAASQLASAMARQGAGGTQG